MSSSTWTTRQWETLDASTRRRVLAASDNKDAERTIAGAGRLILRGFSSSFFLVTRFLPKAKRDRVNIVYAAVRYPDEIADTFPFSPAARLEMLRKWRERYNAALETPDIQSAVRAGIPWILAGFASVVREHAIPHEHYGSFLDAMAQDIQPIRYPTLDSLISQYIYGSAIVVGYFLAHIYGSSAGATMDQACRSASDLAIALQLTNFARDVAEDRNRGRLYLPLELLASQELNAENYLEPRSLPRLRRCIGLLSQEAEFFYERAASTISAFSPDTRPAITACIDVYRQLNLRMTDGAADPGVRHSVPLREKFRVLPPDKYWRLPLAWMGRL